MTTPDTFAIRGVIEGFYGPPWTWDDRAEVMRRCHEWGMTHYVYAPKDDPLHRHRWREPYPDAVLDEFERLAGAGTLEVGFALSPGLSMDYDDRSDRAALVAKLEAVIARGVRLVCLALDDIPVRPGLGAQHARLTAWLWEHLGGRARLLLVPTEYTGTTPTPYLDALAEGVPTEVPIAWTGVTVVCDHITAAQAEERAAALGGRAPLVWDNYPVNDSIMSDRLFTGPLRGRAPELRGRCSGWLANPMVQARASLPALASVAGWLRGDDPETAWQEHLAAAGPELTVFAEACDGAVPDRLVSNLLDAAPGPSWFAAHRAAANWFRDAGAAEAADLGEEVVAWRDQLRAEAALARTALNLLLATRPTGPDGSAPVAVATESSRVAEEAVALAALWVAVRRSPVSVLGPRASVRPVLGQWPDGSWRYHAESVTEGRNALDALVRHALHDVAALATWPGGRGPA